MLEITLQNLQTVFFKMEEDEDLFSQRMSDGTYYWDIVRRNVYLYLHSLHGGPFELAESTISLTLSSKLKNIVRRVINRLTLNYLNKRQPKYIFVTGQRIRSGTALIDNISDHLIELVKDEALAIELMNKKSISYGALIFWGKTRVPTVQVETKNINSEIQEIVKNLECLIKKYFCMSLEVYKIISEPIICYRESKDYYVKLLSSHKPDAIICINNGTLNGMFSAAKESKVPTIELQHGASNSNTIFWSYPSSITSSHPGLSLPTAYLTFSNFWNTNTNYPVKFLDYIGNNYFYQKKIIGRNDGVLIISAYMYREELLELALELAASEKDKKIYYKLHPHEFLERNNVFSKCSKHSNICVISDEIDFSSLYILCDYVVGIHSTTLYIALQAGKKVCIYKRSNYFWHADIFEYIELFDSSTDLREIMADCNSKYFKNLNKAPVFFQPFNPDRFINALSIVSRSI
jgi:hypothetical protein